MHTHAYGLQGFKGVYKFSVMHTHAYRLQGFVDIVYMSAKVGQSLSYMLHRSLIYS